MEEYPWAKNRNILHHDKMVNDYRVENKIWEELYQLLLIKREELPHDDISIVKTFNEIHFQCVRAFLIENPEKLLNDSVNISKKLLGSEQNAYICHCAVYAILSKVEKKSKSINLLLKVYEKRLARQVPEWFEVFKDFAKTISSPEYEEPNFNPIPVSPSRICDWPFQIDENGIGLPIPVEKGLSDSLSVDYYTNFYEREGIILFTKLWHNKDDQFEILDLILDSLEYQLKVKRKMYFEGRVVEISKFAASRKKVVEDLKKFIEKKGDLHDSMPGLYELDKGTYKNMYGNLCGGTYRIPMQTNKVEKSADSPTADTETQTIDKENLIQELTKYFKNTEDAKEFCGSILTAKEEDKPKIYAEFKFYKKVKDYTYNQDIFNILTKFQVYKRRVQTWNNGINKHMERYN